MGGSAICKCLTRPLLLLKTTLKTFFFLCALANNICQAQGDYAGSTTCQGCHDKEYKQWQNSHHAWAMREANASTVLGDFNNVTYSHQGIITEFSQSDGQYFVRTQGADGKTHSFKIAYTFGVEPLQQYLIGFPDGRYQALTVAWDSRPMEEGGQRWYQLMPNDMGQPGESLHWTGVYYNWNSQCAACHSTGLQENYSPKTNSYSSSWTEINVSCESCHGPGLKHSASPATPMPVAYREQLQWLIGDGASIASPLGSPHEGSKVEIESCAGCHSRRVKISPYAVNNYPLGTEFLDHYQPQILREGLYHPDGQIQDEVYVYGSFIQSKMHQRGVRCSNCHEPHSLELKAPGNAVCAGCHAPKVYNSPAHHFHKPAGSPGAQCVNCHMPTTTYMGIDQRRDHSMRIPDPVLSSQIGAPDACTSCHTNKKASWAGQAINSWLEAKGAADRRQSNGYAKAMHAARAQHRDAERLLIEAASDGRINAIARATALGLLVDYPSQKSYETALGQLKDADAIIRLGALEALEFLPPRQRWDIISPLLNDHIKAVRLAATRLLLPSNNTQLGSNIDEYMESLGLQADTAFGQLKLAEAYLAQNLYSQANSAHQQALNIDPHNIAAISNYADSLRIQGQEPEALDLLARGNQSVPNNPVLLHALGLAQIRSGQPALESLRRAAILEPHNSRFNYVYALALNSGGKPDQAIDVLNRALVTSPENRDLLTALATINRDIGKLAKAKYFARRLVEVFPSDARAKQLLQSL